MNAIRLTLDDAQATAALGARLAEQLVPGDAVLLYGDLGMGKSTLARGLIQAALARSGRPPEDAPSPTFTLVQLYEAEPPIAHFDLYRLNGPQEAFELGFDEYLDEGCVVVEWPERLGDDLDRFLGPDRLTLVLSEAGNGRVATVSGAGSWDGRLKDLNERS